MPTEIPAHRGGHLDPRVKDTAEPTKKDNLVYDVGMHEGEDTAYYLKKGFHVVAFEANPELIARNKRRFAPEMVSGRLVIVEGAIVPDASVGHVKFYKCDKSVWGTADSGWARRNAEIFGAQSIEINVPAVDFAEAMRAYGIPHYLKIDIEGMDRHCVRLLGGFSVKPDYISMESEKIVFGKLVEDIELLEALGYTHFMAVQQARIDRLQLSIESDDGSLINHRFLYDSSGPFGEDMPGSWKTKAEVLAQYRRIFMLYKACRFLRGKGVFKFFKRLTGIELPGWHDTHARHGSFSPTSFNHRSGVS